VKGAAGQSRGNFGIWFDERNGGNRAGEGSARQSNAPVFRRKLNSPEAAGVEQFDPDLPGLPGSGSSHPHHLEQPDVAMVQGMDQDGLAQSVRASGSQRRPEPADAEGFGVFAELVPLRIFSAYPNAAPELKP
jgi:hypothetical protein